MSSLRLQSSLKRKHSAKKPVQKRTGFFVWKWNILNTSSVKQVLTNEEEKQWQNMQSLPRVSWKNGSFPGRLTCKRNPAHFKKSEKCSSASSNKTFKSPKYNPYSPVPPKCSVIWVFCVQFRKIGYKPNKQENSTQKTGNSNYVNLG